MFCVETNAGTEEVREPEGPVSERFTCCDKQSIGRYWRLHRNAGEG
jgi:hypothetical protein